MQYYPITFKYKHSASYYHNVLLSSKYYCFQHCGVLFSPGPYQCFKNVAKERRVSHQAPRHTGYAFKSHHTEKTDAGLSGLCIGTIFFIIQLHQYIIKLEMWANAQRDGCPAKYRWRPLFNVAKFG